MAWCATILVGKRSHGHEWDLPLAQFQESPRQKKTKTGRLGTLSACHLTSSRVDAILARDTSHEFYPRSEFAAECTRITWKTRMKEKRRSGHEDTLDTPIPFAVFRAPTIFPVRRRIEIRHFQEVLDERLNTLCLAYEVDPKEVNRHHALILAQRLIPGFQIDRGKRRAHPQKKWDDTRLTALWIFYRSARPRFASDKSAIQSLTRCKEITEITGKAKSVWVEQLLDRARLSPLVQMIESANPADRKFALEIIVRLFEKSGEKRPRPSSFDSRAD
jgi:hypothetical protein